MQRNPYFDNAKAILIFLVIVGHTLSPIFTANHWITTVYIFIYLFHMPAFIIVAGYFTKRMKSKQDCYKLIKKLIIPYMIFQIIYTFYYQGVYGDHLDFSFLDPRWALWFLLSLFCWQLMLVVFGKSKVGILLAFVCSLGVGYIGEINETFTLSRTFFFFPFFILGYFMKKEHFDMMKQKRNVLFAWVAFAVLFVLVYLYGDLGYREWFYGRVGYEEILGESFAYGFLYRGAIYIVMILSTYCFLSIVPKKQLPITKIGSITFTVYVSHMFVLKFVQETSFYDWVPESEQYYVLLIVPVMTMYLLTRKPVVRMCSTVMQTDGWLRLGKKVQNAKHHVNH